MFGEHNRQVRMALEDAVEHHGAVGRCPPTGSARRWPSSVTEPTLLDVAAPEVARLHETLGVSALAAVVEGDEIVTLTARCVPHPFGFEVVAGTRLTLRAPVGTVYVAWSSKRIVRRWLEAAPSLTDARRSALERDLAAVRRRGWSATVQARRGSGHAAGVSREARESDLASQDVAVVGISAPVRDKSDGDVERLRAADIDGLASATSCRVSS
jgi:DNA-binding IclR family transcriptional regulator